MIISQEGYNYSNYNVSKISNQLKLEEDEVKELLTEMQSEMYYASIKDKLDDKYSGIY